MNKNSRDRSPKAPRQQPEPRLGIFWLIDGLLLIDSVTLSESEEYQGYRTHPHSHIEVWEGWQRIGKVPWASEYEEFPRGRLTYDVNTDVFTLLADKCILKRKDLIASIKKQLHLPKQTQERTDAHYRCFTCLHGDDEG